jgi:alpha-beta hydrolase superfamily lysophospholipase
MPPVVIGHSLGGLVVAKYLEKHVAPAAILVAPSPSEGMFWSGLRLQFQNPLLLTECALKQDLAVMFATPERAKKFLFSADADDAKVAEYTARFGTETGKDKNADAGGRRAKRRADCARKNRENGARF